MGYRVVNKIIGIVRAEMDAAGAAEVYLPTVQPAEIWQQSGRWQAYGPELLRFHDRHRRDFCLGPTHEEVITEIARGYLTSYRQLPVNLYQIQTKFRDEIRPRFGIMRAREFIMKDAYSFDATEAGMCDSYELMRATYCRIFDRIGLRYRMVEADSGAIGGSRSHEFMVLANSGEELILYCDEIGYSSNCERTPCLRPEQSRPPPAAPMEKIHTPAIRTIDALADFLADIPHGPSVKTMIIKGAAGVTAVLLRGEHKINLVKAAQQPEIGANPYLLDADEARAILGANFGSLGPVNMPLPVIADYAVECCGDFVCGANEDDYHYLNVNFGRDCPEPRFADLRLATVGDAIENENGRGELSGCRGIEIGHIFQLGDKYSQSMNAPVDTAEGDRRAMLMGCYGIGITRIVAAAIEQQHDERGLIFPTAIAPFEVVICPIGGDDEVTARAQSVYDSLLQAGIDVLYDDRRLRPGIMFADMDLSGIPNRLVISKRLLATGEAEYKSRTDAEPRLIPLDSCVAFLHDIIRGGD